MSEKKGFTPEEMEALKGALSEVESKMGTKAADQIKGHLEVAEKKLAEKYEGELSDLKKFKVDAEKAMAENQKWIDEQIANATKELAGKTEEDVVIAYLQSLGVGFINALRAKETAQPATQAVSTGG